MGEISFFSLCHSVDRHIIKKYLYDVISTFFKLCAIKMDDNFECFFLGSGF